jgi:hypothetical protein
VDAGKHQLLMTASMKVIRTVAPSGGPGGLYKGEFPLPKHDVQHHLQTSGPPLTAKARRLDPAKL